MDHALGVLAGPKDGEAVFGSAEGFDAFVCLLAIVQAGGHAVDGEVWGAHEGWGAPLGGFDAVVTFDVAVDFWFELVRVGGWTLERVGYLRVHGSLHHSNLFLVSCGPNDMI